MEKVTGFGGFFFRAQDPKALGKWYEDHFGITMEPTMYTDDYQPWQQQAGVTVFAPFPNTSDYFPAEKQWMINLRVVSLDAMVSQLTAAGIEVKVDPEVYPHGRFARLYDPEGNAIELWEPPAE